MAIVYDPKKMLRDTVPEAKIKRMVNGRLDLKKAALTFIDGISFVDKKAVSRVALNTIRSYRERRAAEAAQEGAQAGRALGRELAADPALLIQRVQNEVVWQVKEEIKTQYQGEQYEWLPSDAEEPDPEHQLNYGKIFEVGVGEMPGDRYGCRCGMRILVKETQLELE